MTLPKYERKNTIQISVTLKSDGVVTDPYNNIVSVSVFNPDGTYLLKGGNAERTGTGVYRYFISTSATSDLGIYQIQWSGSHNVSGWGTLPFVEREAFQLVEID